MEDEADIVGLDGAGVEVVRIPYDRAAALRLEASLPKMTVKIMEGKKVRNKVLGDSRVVSELRRGYPPIKQVLMIKCVKGLTRDEIRKIIFDDLRYFPKAKFLGMVNKVIDEMVRDSMLSVEGEKLVTGPLKVTGLGEEGYRIERGPYPVYRLIQDTVKAAGRASTMDIADVVHGDWGWLQSRSSVEFWIKCSVEERYLREVEEGTYEAYEEIPSWSLGN